MALTQSSNFHYIENDFTIPVASPGCEMAQPSESSVNISKCLTKRIRRVLEGYLLQGVWSPRGGATMHSPGQRVYLHV